MNRNEQLNQLQEIRSLMERSSRFISLSGLSGVAAGICALIGAALVYVFLETKPFSHERTYYETALQTEKWGLNYVEFFILDAGLVFILAFLSAFYFTRRKALRAGQHIWDAQARRLMLNVMIPMLAGGVFCIALHRYDLHPLIAPTTLVFYGMALLNGSKYTLNDIRFLGVTEIALGLIGLFFPGYGLELWAIGFGLLHIVYGLWMYYRYERSERASATATSRSQ